MYRGRVVEVLDKKNGLYRVRVYPLYVDLKDNELPIAVSNMTNKYFHKSIKKDDWVWVFFEDDNYMNPVIFDFCNIKDKYPNQAKGEKVDYYNLFKKYESEKDIKYEGEYNKLDVYNFDKCNIEIYENGRIVIGSDNYLLVIDSDGSIHMDIKGGVYLKTEDKVVMKCKEMKVDSSDKCIIKCNNILLGDDMASYKAVLGELLKNYLDTVVRVFNMHQHPIPNGSSGVPTVSLMPCGDDIFSNNVKLK